MNDRIPTITDKTARALKAIRDHWAQNGSGIWPARFAEVVWPDSKGHQRSHKCGPYGSSRGAMMAMAAGGYLGKLRKRGLVDYDLGEGYQGLHYLTFKGRKALARHEETEGNE